MRFVLVVLLAGQPKPVDAEVHDTPLSCRQAAAALAERSGARTWCKPTSAPLWRMRGTA